MQKCYICGYGEMEEMTYRYQYRTDTFRGSFPDIKIMFCSKCRLLQTNVENKHDNEVKMAEYYKKEYRGGCDAPKLHDKNSKYYLRGREIANIIKKNNDRDAMSVFEKGCGWGINLLCIKELFPKAEMYTDEPDEHTTEILRNIGIKRAESGKMFDVIIMSHVLEHLLDPVNEIRWAYEHLIANGLLYIEVPNSMNFAEPHVTFWTKDTLLKFFQNVFRLQFDVVECYTTGYPYYVMNNEPYMITYKNWKFVQKIIPASRMQNRKTKNGVYLKLLLRKKEI